MNNCENQNVGKTRNKKCWHGNCSKCLKRATNFKFTGRKTKWTIHSLWSSTTSWITRIDGVINNYSWSKSRLTRSTTITTRNPTQTKATIQKKEELQVTTWRNQKPKQIRNWCIRKPSESRKRKTKKKDESINVGVQEDGAGEKRINRKTVGRIAQRDGLYWLTKFGARSNGFYIR